jgi:hypothetical protein
LRGCEEQGISKQRRKPQAITHSRVTGSPLTA